VTDEAEYHWVAPGYLDWCGVQLGRVTRRKERRLRIRRNKRRRAEQLYMRQNAALIRLLEWHQALHDDVAKNDLRGVIRCTA
jgi:hypothetical protein